MWVEKIIMEKLDEDLHVSSLIIQDKNGELMLISERPPHYRVPFTIISDTNDFNIFEYSSRSPEWYEKRGDIIRVHIRWRYIPLKEPYSGVCYWLRLPPNSVIVDLQKVIPESDRNYSVIKDVNDRTLWLRCMFSREETRGIGLDFVVSYKISPGEYDRFQERDYIRSWRDDVRNLGFGRDQAVNTILKIIGRFLFG